jgi:hypothetical protein
MLRKLAITFFVLILLLGGVMGYLQYMKIKKPISPAIDAVPSDAFIIIQAINAQAVWQNFNQGNPLWTDLKKNGVFEKLNIDLTTLNNVISSDSRLESLIQKNPLFISYHKTDTNTIDVLITCNVPNNIEEEEIKQLIENNVDKSTVFSEYLYQNAIVHEVKYRNQTNKTMCYAKLKGTLVVSFCTSLIKRSIDHLNTNNSLAQNASFNKVYNAVGNNVDASVFVNFGTINSFMPSLLNATALKSTGTLNNLACWAVLDAKLTANTLQFNGFTYTKDSLNNYLGIYKNLKPQLIHGTSVMPANVASYLTVTFDSYTNYITNYKKYLSKNNTLKQYANSIDKLNTKHSINIEKIMNNAYVQEIDLFKLSDADSNNSDIINIHCTDGKIAFNQFKELFTSAPTDNNLITDIVANENDTNINFNDTLPKVYVPKTAIYKLKENKVFSALLGSIYSTVSSNYVLYSNNDFIFASNKATLEIIKTAIKENTTLSSTDGYKNFSKTTSPKANLQWYVSGNKASDVFAKKMNINAALELSKYYEILDKTEGFIVQLTSTGNDMMLTNLYAKYNALTKTIDNTLWKTKLDTAIIAQPHMVINHTNNTKEVIVQDALNNLYLLSCTGEILWKRTLNGVVKGNITQIDKFKNKKLQYVFNTATSIYMLDRTGKDIENFPLKLTSKATNEVGVFDYDKQRDYRLVIACDNNRVYNFDADGGAIAGWNNAPYNSAIHTNIHWFAIKGKDYITVAQDNGTLSFVDRKGTAIATYSKAFNIGDKHQMCVSIKDKVDNSCVITTDNEGTVQKLFVDGHKTSMSINKLSPNHYLDVVDFNEDGNDDVMITEMNYVAAFDEYKKMLFNHKFGSNITQQPTVYKTTANHYKVGVVTAQTSEIFLINNDGSIAEGFPKNGITNFGMTDANKDEINDVIVATAGNYITAYSLTEAGKLYKPKELKPTTTNADVKTNSVDEPKEPIIKKKELKKETVKDIKKEAKKDTKKEDIKNDKKKENKKEDKKTDKTKPNNKNEPKDSKSNNNKDVLKKKTTSDKTKEELKDKTKDKIKPKDKLKDKIKSKDKTKPKEERKPDNNDDDKIINDSSEG